METVEQYHVIARAFARAHGETPSDHIINLMASAMMSHDNVLQGGDFIQAVIKNDLAKAISLADSEVQKNLRIILLAYQFAKY